MVGLFCVPTGPGRPGVRCTGTNFTVHGDGGQWCGADARQGDDRGVAFDRLKVRTGGTAVHEQQGVVGQALQHRGLDGVLVDPLAGRRVARSRPGRAWAGLLDGSHQLEFKLAGGYLHQNIRLRAPLPCPDRKGAASCPVRSPRPKPPHCSGRCWQKPDPTPLARGLARRSARAPIQSCSFPLATIQPSKPGAFARRAPSAASAWRTRSPLKSHSASGADSTHARGRDCGASSSDGNRLLTHAREARHDSGTAPLAGQDHRECTLVASSGARRPGLGSTGRDRGSPGAASRSPRPAHLRGTSHPRTIRRPSARRRAERSSDTQTPGRYLVRASRLKKRFRRPAP